jgi:hypothetical protein
MLQTVSQVVSSGTPNPPPRWTYGYDVNKGQQLNTITVPSPTGTGNSTATINYDSIGRADSLDIKFAQGENRRIEGLTPVWVSFSPTGSFSLWLSAILKPHA